MGVGHGARTGERASLPHGHPDRSPHLARTRHPVLAPRHLSHEELHAFAASAGVSGRAFDRDHYDVPLHLYDQLVALGAIPVPSKQLVQRLIASGLRRRKHLFPPSR